VQLLLQLFLGGLMIGVTVVIHAFVCDFALRLVDRSTTHLKEKLGALWRVVTLVASVFVICSALMFEIWLWTFLLYFVESEIFENIESALYFASVCFSTLGFGDITLSPDWRVLSTALSANGMLLFGWSSAFIFEIMYELYHRDNGGRRRHDR